MPNGKCHKHGSGALLILKNQPRGWLIFVAGPSSLPPLALLMSPILSRAHILGPALKGMKRLALLPATVLSAVRLKAALVWRAFPSCALALNAPVCPSPRAPGAAAAPRKTCAVAVAAGRAGVLKPGDFDVSHPGSAQRSCQPRTQTCALVRGQEDGGSGQLQD